MFSLIECLRSGVITPILYTTNGHGPVTKRFRDQGAPWSPFVFLTLALTLLGTRSGHTQTQFEAVTEEVGIKGLCCTEIAWGDYDNDGWVDLYSDLLWHNQNGTFTQVDGPFEGPGIWGDYDNDGDLDLYLYSEGPLIRNDGPDGFTDVRHILDSRPMLVCRSAAWADFNGDGFLDLYITGYEIWESSHEWHDVIFRNNGGKSFTRVWQTPHIRRTRGVTCADYDEDGDIDIYVSNYRLQPNYLFRNDGDFHFTDVAAAVGNVDGDGGSGAWGHSVGSAWCDFDNDGHFDLFVGNFSHPPAYQDRCKIYRAISGKEMFTFQEQPGEIVRWQESYATCAFGDYDNDGFVDLYLTTRYPGDTGVLFHNAMADPTTDKWTLNDATVDSRTSHNNPGSYQAAWADFDNDGDLDLATSGLIMRNRGNGQHWLKVRLQGSGVNAFAIGARVQIQIGKWKLIRQVEGGTGEGNQNDLTLHFGLGKHKDPVEIEVQWPDGTQQLETSAVDRCIEIFKP